MEQKLLKAAGTYGYQEGAMPGVDPTYSYITGEFDSGQYNWKDIYKSFKSNTTLLARHRKNHERKASLLKLLL